MLVADIKKEVIIGMEIMNSRAFQLDFKRGTLTVNDKEVMLHGKSDEVVSLLLGEDTSILERIEMILVTYLEDNVRIGDTTWSLLVSFLYNRLFDVSISHQRQPMISASKWKIWFLPPSKTQLSTTRWN